MHEDQETWEWFYYKLNLLKLVMNANLDYCRSNSSTPLHHDDCINEEKLYCNYLSNLSQNASYCRPIFDGIHCWKSTPPDTISEIVCPKFFAGFNIPGRTATKKCLENGHWFVNESNDTWTNYSRCFKPDTKQVPIQIPFHNISHYGNESLLEVQEYLPIIKYMSRTGYFISLSTLIVAFCILFSFKKLHCARNKLHMHLFASFIFRAAISFIKDILFIDGVGMMSDIQSTNGSVFFDEQSLGSKNPFQSNNWQCKVITSVWQYFITANYSWILMEGVYLHNLILLALFSDSNSSIKYYIIFGWGLPAIVVGSYVIARIYLDNTLCWTVHEKSPNIFLIIRIPTMLSILINLVLFINIARVLLLKLRSPISEETKLFQRWARSTLVLVPLFGVHYAIFMGMSYSIGINATVEIIWLFCDQLFASFQGFFVAVLYCFLNGEVKTELRPHINSFIACMQSIPIPFVNCGESVRSTAGRPSVCTTLSCSSLYNSSVNHKYSGRKSKWDIQVNGNKLRHPSIPENYHICHPTNEKNCHDHSNHKLHYDSSTTALKCSDESCCFSSKQGTQLTEITEITACLGQCDHNSKTDSPGEMEMIAIKN